MLKMVIIMVLALPLSTPAQQAEDLARPVQVLVGGKPIDMEVGHAHPHVADIDGDGLKDLLVGQMGGGKLGIFRNVGTDAAPRFAERRWFKAGKGIGRVPSG